MEAVVRPGAARTYALFFLSGISGLIYQVIWVRQFGNLFGNTVQSAAAVTSVFMLGLGVGSWWIGGLGDRAYVRDPRGPLRAYAYSELAIGLMGLLLAFLLPHTEVLSTWISSYQRDENGWQVVTTMSHLLRYLAAFLLLAPITTIMGGTLTLLVRFVVQDELGEAGFRIGVLYGLNTAGAALGALATDFVLVPWFGLFGAQGLAVAINLLVSLFAFRYAREPAPGAPPSVEVPQPAAQPSEVVSPPPHSTSHRWIVVAIALAGFAGMGLEIVWFRLLASMLGAQRSTFSMVIGVILVGIWLGSTVGGWLQRRYQRAGMLLFCAEAGLAVAGLCSLQALHHVALGPLRREAAVVILTAVGAPALLMGCAFPLANALLQRHAPSVGSRAGALYLANTVGSVAGSTITGFVLLPALGSQSSVLLLCGTAGVIVPLALVAAGGLRSTPGFVPVASISSALVLAALLSFASRSKDYLLEVVFPLYSPATRASFLDIQEGINETLAVVQTEGVRTLMTNGHPMSNTAVDAQRYMRAFVHVPLLQIEAPKDALVICFGVGNTLHATSLHPSLERIEIADLSHNVLSHGGFFAATNGNVLSDPRVQVFVNDGRQHLRTQPAGRYDLITLEPPPLVQAGVSALYSKEFFALAASRLKPGGFLSEWLPVYQLSPELVAEVVRAFVEVFPNAVLISGFDQEMILLGRQGPTNTIDIEDVLRRAAERPRVAQDLERIGMATGTEIVGSFVASSATLVHATRDARPMTDEYPSMEYDQGASEYLLAPMVDVTGVRDWCPSCFDAGRAKGVVADLPAYLDLLGPTYIGAPSHAKTPEQAALITSTKYLKWMRRGPKPN